MSGLWGETKSYSGYVWKGFKFILSPATPVLSAAGQAAGGTVGGWIGWLGGTLISAIIPTPPPVIAVGGAAMGGTLIGQGVNGLISLWHDPIAPMDWIRPDTKYGAISDGEIDAFLTEISLLTGIAFAHPPGLDISANDLGQTEAGFLFVREGVRTFVSAAQAAAVRSHSTPADLTAALSAVQHQLRVYRGAIQGFADALDRRPSVADQLPTLSLRQYQEFIDEVRRNGHASLPPFELFIFQRMLTLAGVRYPDGDYRTNLATWVASGPSDMELQAFQHAPGQTLTLSDILRGSLGWYWSRIHLASTIT